MDRPDAEAAQPRARLLDLRSGGWVLLLAGMLCLGIVAWWLGGLLHADRRARVGDGRDVESYGFDLSISLVPREQIVASGLPKDGLPALSDPTVFTPAQAEQFGHELRKAHQGKFLVGPDRVIGVSINGKARAYPLRIMNWHEVVNDTLGDVPIAVTYGALCDSAVVFDRRVGGETLEFGVSGLLCNTNLLMYDRRPRPSDESLWCQLQFRAVAGPAATRGDRLQLVPAALVHWSDWLARHPETTVLTPDRSRTKLYRRTYGRYFGSQELRFPVEPLPPAGRPLKTPVIALRLGGAWQVYDITGLARRVGDGETCQLAHDGEMLEIMTRTDPASAWVTSQSREPVEAVYAFWFAWYAHRPDGRALVEP